MQNHVKLTAACEQMALDEKYVRALIKKHPSLAPPKAFGDSGPFLCTSAWMDGFKVTAAKLEDGICLHCSKLWDSLEEPRAETPPPEKEAPADG